MEEGGVVDEGNTVIMDKGQKSSSIVELDLRVGAYSTPQQEAKNPVISGPFTETQRRELHHQVFIFNHFANNLPLPPHIVQCFGKNINFLHTTHVCIIYGTLLMKSSVLIIVFE